MSQKTFLIVGASRGVGKALVDEISKIPSNHVFATTRKPIDFNKPNVSNIILEQTDSNSILAAVPKINSLDVLIVNAAIGNMESLLTTSTERFQEYMDTNVVGVHRVVNAFVPALRNGTEKKIIIVSSGAGSISNARERDFGFRGPYSVTKAANNMQAALLHRELRGEGFKVLSLHPGWVDTDMGNVVKAVAGGRSPISGEVSARGILEVIEGLTPEQSGLFMSYDGTQIAW